MDIWGHEYAERGPIVWYENLTGDGLTWTRRTAGPGDSPSAATPVDLDGDGDLDGLSASGLGPTSIVRHTNQTLHRSACFAPAVTVSTAADALHGLAIADVDRDGETWTWCRPMRSPASSSGTRTARTARAGRRTPSPRSSRPIPWRRRTSTVTATRTSSRILVLLRTRPSGSRTCRGVRPSPLTPSRPFLRRLTARRSGRETSTATETWTSSSRPRQRRPVVREHFRKRLHLGSGDHGRRHVGRAGRHRRRRGPGRGLRVPRTSPSCTRWAGWRTWSAPAPRGACTRSPPPSSGPSCSPPAISTATAMWTSPRAAARRT